MPAQGGSAPPPPVVNPPTITNVASTTSYTAASVTWNASSQSGISNSTFVYGLTTNYGSNGSIIGSYQVNLSGLSTSTIYYFKISVTSQDGQAEYSSYFRTAIPPPDVTAPVISNVAAVPGVTTSSISWQTNEQADSQVNYGITVAYGSTVSDTNQTLSHTLSLSSFLPNTTYHYRVISVDSSGNSANSSDQTFTTLKDNVAPPDVSNLQLTADAGAISLSWTNPDVNVITDFTGVVVVRKVGSPSANVSDGATVYSGTGQSFVDSNVVANTNYFYTVFSVDTSVNYSSGAYTNGQLVVVTPPPPEPAPTPEPSPTPEPAPTPGPSVGSVGSVVTTTIVTTTSEIPTPTVPSFLKIEASAFVFLTGNNRIRLIPDANRTITGLAYFPLTVELPKKNLAALPIRLSLKFNGNEQHQMAYNSATETYVSTVTFGSQGLHRLHVEMDYGAGQLDTLDFTVNALNYGFVNDNSGALKDVQIFLFHDGGARFEADVFGETNPIFTEDGGSFGWMVPNGRYFIVANKENYYERKFPIFSVENNTVNPNIFLIKKPPSLAEAIDPNASIGKNVANVAGNLAVKTKVRVEQTVQSIVDTAKVVEEVKKNPEVKKTARVAAPTAVSVVAVSTVTLVSWADVVSLLRFLFLQPLMLLGLKRRSGWGQVYNALNKLPVDLATIRLVHAETGRILQSKVSDKKGRYAFVVDPGSYRLEVSKTNLVFPSALLKDLKSDGRRIDIYHGENIIVTAEDAMITANIPLDPAGEFRKPIRIVLEKIGRRLQAVLSWVGLLVTIASLYISPKWYVWLLLILHVGISLGFKRIAKPPKIKSWGIVYDAGSRKPLPKTVARLFSSQFNKLVATQITDSKGRYYFLAGDNHYYVTYDHPEYQARRTEVINLEGKEAEPITVNVGMSKETKN